MKERRKLQRFSMRIPAKIVGNGKNHQALELETRDISSDGAFLVTDMPLEAGTKLTLALELPLRKIRQLFKSQRRIHLKIRGLVIRKEASGVAVQFHKQYKFDFAG